MPMRFGANTWIWVALLTGADRTPLVPHVADDNLDLSAQPARRRGNLLHFRSPVNLHLPFAGMMI